MEIKFSNKTFLPKLNQVVGVVSQKTAIPILSCVRIDVANNEIRLTASNGDATLTMKAELISCDFDNKSFCVESADFSKALRNLGEIDVRITLDESTHIMTCYYRNGHFCIPYQEADEYVTQKFDFETATEISLNAPRMLQAMNAVSFAIANDELRPVMNTIHFDFFKDAMVVVASDGKKLAKYRDTSVTHEFEDDKSFNFPSRSTDIAKKILAAYEGDVVVKFNDNAAMLYCDEFTFSTTLVEGRFPRYQSVIPKQSNYTVVIDKTSFNDALRRVSSMANAATNLISLAFADEKLTINAEDIDYSKAARETIDCDYAFTNPPLTIGFDATCLLQVLACFTNDMVHVDLIDPTKACVLYDNSKDDYLVLLMPMRI